MFLLIAFYAFKNALFLFHDVVCMAGGSGQAAAADALRGGQETGPRPRPRGPWPVLRSVRQALCLPLSHTQDAARRGPANRRIRYMLAANKLLKQASVKYDKE